MNTNVANNGAGQKKVMGPLAWFVGQDCGNFLLKDLKFRRHVYFIMGGDSQRTFHHGCG